MRDSKIRTSYNIDPTPGVMMSDELITEQSGYRSTKEIVEGMILAGQRLEDYRHGRLDEFLEDSYQEPIERYQRDPVEEEADIVRKLRYRSVKNEKTEETVKAEIDEDSTKVEEKVQETVNKGYPSPGSDGMKSGMDTGF